MNNDIEIDCLILGNNQMVFDEYVNSIKRMGENSGAFRDLNLSYFEEDGQVYSCTRYVNEHFLLPGEIAMSYDNIFSGTISYLGSFLDKEGFSFEYINSFQEGKEELRKLLCEKHILSIAITTTYYVSVLPILEVIQFIKKYNQTAKIIIGGPFIDTQYRINNENAFRFLLDQFGADCYVVSSQGEQTLVSILDAIKNNKPLEDVPNLIYKRGEKYHINPIREEDSDLGENMVQWKLFSHQIEQKQQRMLMVRSAKSCPFSCTFCSFPERAGKYRYVDPETLCSELDAINRIGIVNSVTFIDDTFNVPLRRYKEILNEMIARNYAFKWNCNFRCQYADDEVVSLMKKSGCEGVFLGIESGSDRILKNMNKSATAEHYRKGIELLKGQGILTYASFIVGFPGETEETVMETFQFIESTKPDFFRVQLWYYDTMTPIFHEAEKYGLKNSQFEWAHNTMNAEEAAYWMDYFHANISNSTWLPQNDFDFPSIFNLLSRGWSIPKMKEVIQEFNEKVLLKNHTNKVIKGGFLDQQMLSDSDFSF